MTELHQLRSDQDIPIRPPGDNSRQHGKSLDLIRRDHLERYYHAMAMLRGPAGQLSVLDAACGNGYGAYLLGTDGHEVVGVDVSREAIRQAIAYYDSDNVVQWITADLMARPWGQRLFDAVVTLETLEHLPDAPGALAVFRRSLKEHGTLVASVPNQAVYPFDPANFKDDEFPHQRHYTPEEFQSLLTDTGFEVLHRGVQVGKFSPVTDGTNGRFLVYTCRPAVSPWLETR